jgi:uncharacterized protein (UPF0262 family)
MRAMAASTLSDLKIDEATWSAGSAERRHEWRLAIQEVLSEGVFESEDDLARAVSGLVRLEPGKVRFEFVDEHGAALPASEIPKRVIEPLVEEYIRTITEMTKLGVGSNSPRLEALDIAKRLTHDEAGELVVSHLRGIKPDHATARRLFTLLVTLFHDTTRLAAPPHRVLY